MTLTKEYLKEYLNHFETEAEQRSILLELLQISKPLTVGYYNLIETIQEYIIK